MISIIVACSENNVIGKDNKLLWKQSADLKRFKEITSGKSVIMGRKTYDSIGKPLPNRRNIVITRQNIHIPGVEIFNSMENIITEDETFVIGGGEIYKESIIFADKIYLTKIHTELDGDSYFPFLGKEWIIESEEFHKKDEKNQYDYSFINLIKNGKD